MGDKTDETNEKKYLLKFIDTHVNLTAKRSKKIFVYKGFVVNTDNLVYETTTTSTFFYKKLQNNQVYQLWVSNKKYAIILSGSCSFFYTTVNVIDITSTQLVFYTRLGDQEDVYFIKEL